MKSKSIKSILVIMLGVSILPAYPDPGDVLVHLERYYRCTTLTSYSLGCPGNIHSGPLESQEQCENDNSCTFTVYAGASTACLYDPTAHECDIKETLTGLYGRYYAGECVFSAPLYEQPASCSCPEPVDGQSGVAFGPIHTGCAT